MKDLIKKILKEDNELDWIRDVNPISKVEIAEELIDLRDVGYYIHDPERSRLVDTIYGLGLDKERLKSLSKALYGFGDSCFDVGRDEGQQASWGEAHNEGYNEGYEAGQDDMRSEMESEAEDKYEEGYDKGYYDGEEEGHELGYKKGYEEGSEKTYYKAFEEGRAYEAGLDVEDLERRESGFDPREYDEDYDENY